jgi:hypothetical protein
VTYFRRFEGYTPPERTVTHWNRYRIEEAAAPSDAGAVVIDGPSTLSPAITDPMSPPTYSFETSNATLASAWYRVAWLDANGDTQPTPWVPLRNLSPYAPSVGDVATVLRARAVENGGLHVDTFTDQTNPTAQQVQQTIIMFAPLVLARLGRLDNLGCSNSEDLRAAATAVTAQRVALEVEASYWPEEVAESASFEIRRTMLDADTLALVESLAVCRSSGDEGGGEGESVSRSDPAWAFPPHCPLRF